MTVLCTDSRDVLIIQLNKLFGIRWWLEDMFKQNPRQDIKLLTPTLKFRVRMPEQGTWLTIVRLFVSNQLVSPLWTRIYFTSMIREQKTLKSAAPRHGFEKDLRVQSTTQLLETNTTLKDSSTWLKTGTNIFSIFKFNKGVCSCLLQIRKFCYTTRHEWTVNLHATFLC